MAILITGGTGFVGSAVVRRVLALDQPVRVLVRATSDRRNLDDLPVCLVEGDLTDRASLDRALSGCSGLFHVAADYRLWARNPEEIYRHNVDGTVALLKAAAHAGVKRIVYTSSVATLKAGEDGSIADENTPVSFDDMIGTYKRSKFRAEQAVQKMITESCLPVVIVNPSTPVGPRDIKPTPTGQLVLNAAAGRMPAFVDTGLNIVHVDDVAQGHVQAFEHGKIGERYILGGDNLSLQEILHCIATIMNHKAPRYRIPHKVGMFIAALVETWAKVFRVSNLMITRDGIRMAKKKMYFSSAKAEKELGYTHQPAEQGLRDAIEWYRNHGYLD